MREIGMLVCGMLIGVLAFGCFSYPQVGRAIGKVLAVIGIGLGAGLVAWGIASSIADDFKPMQAGTIYIMSVSQVFGWGAGSLAGGITALVLSLAGRDSC
jgi:hypothetical protein